MLTTPLTNRHCQACNASTPALSHEQTTELLALIPGWRIEDGHLLLNLKLASFAAALDLVNRIGALAEAEGHHPDLLIHSWNRLRITLYTHAIGGLSENDFILAAKINALANNDY
jgi:4a-hydroxytetrahydrobiopterin dehydratase